MKDYYRILIVDKEASAEEIKRSYRILAQQYHPDRNSGNEERFREIIEAYRLLSDEKSRKEYDQKYTTGTNYTQPKENTQQSASQSSKSGKATHFLTPLTGTIIGLSVIAILVLFNSVDEKNLTPIQETSFLPTTTVATEIQLVTILPPTNTNEKCVTEDSDLKICDLSHSSTLNTMVNMRDVSLDGNYAACINLETGELTSNISSRIRAHPETSICATDFGSVYIDPSIEVYKYYQSITRDNYNSPHKTNRSYDACIWTYNDGNGNIPYIEVLSSVGPRYGYNMKAFCINSSSQVDLYTYLRE